MHEREILIQCYAAKLRGRRQCLINKVAQSEPDIDKFNLMKSVGRRRRSREKGSLIAKVFLRSGMEIGNLERHEGARSRKLFQR